MGSTRTNCEKYSWEACLSTYDILRPYIDYDSDTINERELIKEVIAYLICNKSDKPPILMNLIMEHGIPPSKVTLFQNELSDHINRILVGPTNKVSTGPLFISKIDICIETLTIVFFYKQYGGV